MTHQASEPLCGQTNLKSRARRLAHSDRMLTVASRRIVGTTPDELIAALLFELSETILPRRFKLLTDTQNLMYLLVANRRLIAFGPDMASTSLAHDTGEKVLAQLHDLFAKTTSATLARAREEKPLTSSSQGISIFELARIGALALTSPPDPDPVPVLFNAVAGQLSAWVSLDAQGNLRKHNGRDEHLQRLTDLVRNGLPDIDQQLNRSLIYPNQPGCLILGANGPDALALVYARSQQSRLLALLPTGEIANLQPAWQAFYNIV